jgi:hypothetical protein
MLVVTATEQQLMPTAVSFRSSVVNTHTQTTSKKQAYIKEAKKNNEKTTILSKDAKKIAHQSRKKMAQAKQITKKKLPIKKVAQLPEPKKIETSKEVKSEPPAQPVQKIVQSEPVPLVEKKEVAELLPEPTILAPCILGEQYAKSATVQDPFLIQYALLQEEVSRHWKPPVGMQPSGMCHITAIITNEGTIQTLTIAQSSGILVFDIAARNALFASTWPAWVKGKIVTIVFK